MRVLASTPVTPMPAFVAAAGAPPQHGGAPARGASRRRADRPWFAPLAELLLLEGFAAVTRGSYAPLLDWDARGACGRLRRAGLTVARAGARYAARSGMLRARRAAGTGSGAPHRSRSRTPARRSPRSAARGSCDSAAGTRTRGCSGASWCSECRLLNRNSGPRIHEPSTIAMRSRTPGRARCSAKERISWIAVRRHHHRQEIDPQRHAAHELQPQHHRHAPQQVLEPHAGAGSVLFARQRAHTRRAGSAPMRQNGTDEHAAGERLLHLQQRARRGAQARASSSGASRRTPDHRADR